MLYVVPTPIGHLADITLRAIDVLRQTDFIIAEDTRVASFLLRHLGIAKPIKSYHLANEHRVVKGLCDLLEAGQTACLITDAGTPSISDPGYLLVRMCLDREVSVQCLPGPTAFVPALVVSGLPVHHFYFEGFLPQKKGRQTRLEFLATLADTFVLYESPHRIAKCIAELSTHCTPQRPACLCRELTKRYEEIVRGTLQDIADWAAAQTKIRGEIVLVVAGLQT